MKPMSMTQKIIAANVGRPFVQSDEHVIVNLDLAFAHDPVMAVMVDLFEKTFGKEGKVWDPEKIALFQDHLVPAKDIESTKMIQLMDRFVKKQKITHYFPYGKNYGVCHIIILEEGLARPGNIIVGTDSHTVTYGSFNCLATGMGVFDVAVAFGVGKVWMTVPKPIKVKLNGSLRPGVGAKDIILELVGRLGLDGARGCSVEFEGAILQELTLDERSTLCNMVVEAGATNGIMALNDSAREFLRSKGCTSFTEYQADSDCDYYKEIEIECEQLRPKVALPHRPDNVVFADELKDRVPIHQVYVGSCTGGKYDDILEFCTVLGDGEVAEGLTVVVVPATVKIYKRMLEEGLTAFLLTKGIVVESPGCKACYGVHGGVTRDNENCLATINRNFLGRMGNPKSNIYLSSPYVAAQSAKAGYITI